jgi:hypothetical protein
VSLGQWVKYVLSCVLLALLLISLIVTIILVQLPIGSRAVHYWVLVFFLSLLQDGLILLPLSVLRSAVVLNATLRNEVLTICSLLSARFRSISRRRLGMMRDANAFIQVRYNM